MSATEAAPVVATDTRPPLSLSELARRLGLPKWLARWIVKCGEIPSTKTRQGIRVNPRDVDRYIATCKARSEAAPPPTRRQLEEEVAREALIDGELPRCPRPRERAGTARRRANRSSARSSSRSGDSGNGDSDGPGEPVHVAVRVERVAA
jgi:excisionase family DNA binding protein